MKETVYVHKDCLGLAQGHFEEDLILQLNDSIIKDTNNKKYRLFDFQDDYVCWEVRSVDIIIQRLEDKELFRIHGATSIESDRNSLFYVFRKRYDQDTGLLSFSSCRQVLSVAYEEI